MKKSALSLLLLLAMIGAVLIAPAGANNDEKYLKASDQLVILAEEAILGEAFYDALNYLEQAIVANPQNVRAYVALGQVHEELGRLFTGLKYYAIALTIDPFDLGALEAEALAKIADGDVEAAAENLVIIRRHCGDDNCAEAERVDTALQDAQA